MKIYQLDSEIYEHFQSYERLGLTSVLPLIPDTYRDEAVLIIQGLDPTSQRAFLDLLVLDGLQLQFKSAVGSRCSADDVIDWKQWPKFYDVQTEGLDCLTGPNAAGDFSSSTSLIVNQSLSLIVPYDALGHSRTLIINLGIRLRDLDSPVVQERAQVESKMDEYANALEVIRQRSNRLNQVVEGRYFISLTVNMICILNVLLLQAQYCTEVM